MSNINTDEDARQKRDNIHQRTQSQENNKQTQRQTKQKDIQSVETKKTYLPSVGL